MLLYTRDSRPQLPGMPQVSKKQREDFKIPERKRTFALRLMDDERLYVNPYFFETMSEDFRRRFRAINDIHGEVIYDDITVHDMHLLLSSVCPDLYHLYPTPIFMSHLPSLLPLAKRLEMPKLLLCCEKVLENDLHYSSNWPQKLLTSFDYAYKYDFNLELQAQLLQRLLKARFPEDIANENLFYEKTGHVLALAHIQFLKKQLAHTALKLLPVTTGDDGNYEACQKSEIIKCSKCLEESRLITKGPKRHRRQKKPIKIAAFQCSACEQQLCSKCLRTPCSSALVDFLKKYSLTFFAKNSKSLTN